MILEGELGKLLRETLLPHAAHEIVIATYGDVNDPSSVAVECDTCSEVLISDGET